MRGKPIELIKWLLEQPKDKIFILKEFKKGRNLKQNAKYWKLVNKLALVLKLSVEEVHRSLLKDYSVRYEILIPAEEEIRGIEYFEKKSKIIKNNKEFIVYWVFVPSHELKMDEFSNLLDGLVQECKNVGIETEVYDDYKK